MKIRRERERAQASTAVLETAGQVMKEDKRNPPTTTTTTILGLRLFLNRTHTNTKYKKLIRNLIMAITATSKTATTFYMKKIK